jgi:hypothetical protein
MSHNVAVKLGLIGKPDPALAEISQELGLRLALWQAQQATAFLGLKSAIFRVVHDTLHAKATKLYFIHQLTALYARLPT